LYNKTTMERLSYIVVYLDTNCIGARGRDPFINELYRLADEEKIAIETTETQENELREGKGYPLGTKKIFGLIESFNEADSIDSRSENHLLGEILQILWGKKDNLTKQQERDGRLIAASIKYGGMFFVTKEKNLLFKADYLEKKYRIKIRTPRDCLEEVKNLMAG